ncbi:unnamed protein product [Orchesella dallaii]|uniref:Exonuclease 3'-5' domain-containing protein 1 n=1 Tax=Orchesella dallaii TaxID=48710 RepID=A0ABP1PMZ2_9HEXA
MSYVDYMDYIYTLNMGTTVEVELRDSSLRGQFDLVCNGTGRNPDIDEIRLERATEVASGKKRMGTVSFPIKDVIKIKTLARSNIFKKQSWDIKDFPDLDSPSVSQRSKTKENILGSKAVPSRKGKPQEMDLPPVVHTMRTYVVTEEPMLNRLFKSLPKMYVCGIAFDGQNVGRHGVVAWIILTGGKGILLIDMDSLSKKVPDVWKLLEKFILRNTKLVKIMHDSRPAADYLWHVHGIKMVNVFDTQVADAHLSLNHNGDYQQQLKPLSDCLELRNRRIPPEEFEFLRKFESQDFSTNFPVLKKPLPPPDYLKLCELKVKYLIPLRQSLMKKIMEELDRCTEAHMYSYRNLSNEAYLAMSKVEPPPNSVPPVEHMMRTYVVKEEPMLNLLFQLLPKIDVCGIAFEGHNVGRHGVVAWIILTGGKRVILIDMDSLSVKVPDVADAYVFLNHNGDYPQQLKPLSDCLELCNRRIPPEEFEFLRKYESQDFSTNSPMLKMPLPPPDYLKLCELKGKYLIPLCESLMKKMMER